jgi:hypothetical protein
VQVKAVVRALVVSLVAAAVLLGSGIPLSAPAEAASPQTRLWVADGGVRDAPKHWNGDDYDISIDTNGRSGVQFTLSRKGCVKFAIGCEYVILGMYAGDNDTLRQGAAYTADSKTSAGIHMYGGGVYAGVTGSYLLDEYVADANGVVQSLSVRFTFGWAGQFSYKSAAPFGVTRLAGVNSDLGNFAVGSQVSRSVDIKNIGETTVVLGSDFHVTNPTHGHTTFALGRNECVGVTLAPGQTCRIDVVLSAVAASSASTAIEFHHSGRPIGLHPERIGLYSNADSVYGQAESHKWWAPSLFVGDVSDVIRVPIKNKSQYMPLSLTGIRLIGGHEDDFYLDPESPCFLAPVAPNKSCDVEIYFSPTKRGNRSIHYAIEGNSLQAIEFSVEGRGMSGYRIATANGDDFVFGDNDDLASATKLNKPVVGVAATATGEGHWNVARDGGVFAHGDAEFFGSAGGIPLNKPVVGIAATPTGGGYRLVASDGGVFAYGDAKFFGSTGSMTLNKPIVGIAASPTGEGYWLVASDGGVFAFGDAAFFGSTGSMTLNKPIVGMAADPFGAGYWLVASDGGIFAFGEAPFYGSTGSIDLNQPITGMASTPNGDGYWLVASDGGVFTFGAAPFLGSAGDAGVDDVIGIAFSARPPR